MEKGHSINGVFRIRSPTNHACSVAKNENTEVAEKKEREACRLEKGRGRKTLVSCIEMKIPTHHIMHARICTWNKFFFLHGVVVVKRQESHFSFVYARTAAAGGKMKLAKNDFLLRRIDIVAAKCSGK